MSFEDPQPGDKAPRDRPRPGDRDELRGLHGPDDIAGDRAPDEDATAADREKFHRQLTGEDAPLGQGDSPGGPGEVSAVHFSAPFIKRPVATFLLSLAIIIAGAVAYKLLPVSSLPEVEYPVISVGASLPGADPETMASAVATPLERQFTRIAGVNQMTSSSGTGSTSITMQFDLNRDINGAARDVQAAINAARAQLPANLPSNPTYRKINPADAPILILALTSDTVPLPQMYDASDSILAQKIAAGPRRRPVLHRRLRQPRRPHRGQPLPPHRQRPLARGPPQRHRHLQRHAADRLPQRPEHAHLALHHRSALRRRGLRSAHHRHQQGPGYQRALRPPACPRPSPLRSLPPPPPAAAPPAPPPPTPPPATPPPAPTPPAPAPTAPPTPASPTSRPRASPPSAPPTPPAPSASVTSPRSSTPSPTSTPAAPSTASAPSSSSSSSRPAPTSSRPSTTSSPSCPQLQASISPAIKLQVVA